MASSDAAGVVAHGAMPCKKRVVTTDSNHRHGIAENVLDRQCTASALNQKWVSDTVYVDTDEGWLYLTTVMDLFGCRVVDE